MMTVEEFVLELRSLKTNKQKELISKSLDEGNEIFYAVLAFTYNINYNYYIKKIPSYNRIGDNSISDVWPCFADLLNLLRTRKITGNDALEALVNILKTCNDTSAEILECIIRKDLKANISYKTINAATKPFELPDFKIQLANTYDPDKNYKTDTFYASPKMDGLRAIYLYDASLKIGTFYSRTGKVIEGFDWISDDLEKICSKNNISMIDGELYTHGDSFESIQSSIANKGTNATEEELLELETLKKKIKYNAFICMMPSDGPVSTKNATELLESALNDFKSEYINFIKQVEIKNDLEEINRLIKGFVDLGYEGIMLRNPDNAYSWKRDDNLLKYKLFKESDFKIIAWYYGEDKYKDMLGGFLVRGELFENGNVYQILSKVGSGFSEAQRESFVKCAENLVGKNVEIKYQNITTKPNKEGYFSLRFPVFLKVKDDD